MPIPIINKLNLKLSKHQCPLNPETLLQFRVMTTSKRVQDRSKYKRVHDLEIATEKWKIFSKIHFLMEAINSEPEHVIPIRLLERLRRQINLPKPHKLTDFLRKSPKLFELYKDSRGILWVGMTQQAEELVEEEEREIQKHSDKAAEYVTRFLMMSRYGKLRVDKIAHFRRDLGLPMDFRTDWVHRYPKLFRVVKSFDEDVEYLELVARRREWAVTELEKKQAGSLNVDEGHCPGKLSLAFPVKYPPDYGKLYRYGGKIEHFQKREYLSPYADASELKPGSLEFDKRAVAVMHELLSFTLGKRLVTDHLTHFREEFVMPQKLMRLLLKHFGIFYVSERGKRFHVFLTEAYEGSELIEKCPLVLWRDKVQGLIGYRGRKKKIETFEEFSGMEEEEGLLKSESDDEELLKELHEGEMLDDLDDALDTDDAEMDLNGISDAYSSTL